MLMCGPDEATTNVICIDGFEIEFYPNVTLEGTLLALRETEILTHCRQQAKKKGWFLGDNGVSCGCCCVFCWYGVGGGNGGQNGSILKHQVGIG